jgi:cyanophycinase
MRVLIVLLFGLVALAADVGPQRGTLVVVGGGRVGPEIQARFLALAGGAAAPLVIIPTAGEAESYGSEIREVELFRKAGFAQVSVLHTRDRAVADSEAFTAPLRNARAVWFSGGRQWRLVDSYLNTRTQRELEALLARGGVIGGTSAGATIQGSYLVRGAREGNTIMMAPGYEVGFGYLRNVAVDQHLIARKREGDLVAVIERHPELLGIGIDESTAIVVSGDAFEVIGASKVAIYAKGNAAPGYFFLEPGARFDLKSRRAVSTSEK